MIQQEVSKRRLIAIKIYFDRARMYLGYINFFILNVVLINSIENPTLKVYVTEYKWLVIPILFVFYSVLLVLIGYLDTRLGFRQEEMRNNAAINPIIQDIVTTVHQIHDKVNEQPEASSNSNQD